MRLPLLYPLVFVPALVLFPIEHLAISFAAAQFIPGSQITLCLVASLRLIVPAGLLGQGRGLAREMNGVLLVMIGRGGVILGVKDAVNSQFEIGRYGALAQQLLQRLHSEIVTNDVVDVALRGRVRGEDDLRLKLLDDLRGGGDNTL